jgi:hypothetical protein
MDPVTGTLIAEGMKMSVALFLAWQRSQGKTEAEVNAMLSVELAKAMTFDPNSIKDV